MKTKGVIIIEGHVQGLANARALGEQNIPVVVVDIHDCVAARSKHCDAFYKCPPFLDDSFADFLIDLAKREALQGWMLLPSNDHAVYCISRNKSKLAHYYKLVTPDLDTIENIYDKTLLLKLAESVNVPFPKTHCFLNEEEKIPQELKFPLLTKGRNGLSFYKKVGKKVFLSENESEFRIQIKELEKIKLLKHTFTQELIPFDGTNKTISVAAFSIDGNIAVFWMGIKLREHPLTFGTATFTESVYEDECLNHSKAVMKGLSYTGVCEIEFLLDPRDGKFKLIEINARTWLWVGHAIANGINFPVYLYEYVNGIKTTFPKTYDTGLKWRNPITDFIYTIIALVKGQLSLEQVRRQNKGKVINALWDRNDKKPFYRYIKLMFSFIKNR